MGLTLAFLLIISAVTGVLLALKKDVDIIQPPTQRGMSDNLMEWKSLGEINSIAESALHNAYPEQKENFVDRMDIRPSKGIVKILFEDGNWELATYHKTHLLYCLFNLKVICQNNTLIEVKQSLL